MYFVALKTDVFYYRLKRLARKWMQALKQSYDDLPVLSGLTPNTNTLSTAARSWMQYPNLCLWAERALAGLKSSIKNTAITFQSSSAW